MTASGTATVAALQYCAAGTSEETLTFLLPMIGEAAEQGAGIVSLPEAATFLAPNRKALEDEAEDEAESRTLDALRNCAAAQGIDLHVGSIFLRRADGRLVNRAAMIGADGSVRALYDKIHMFDANVGDGKRYRESDYFAAGDRMVMTESGGWQLGWHLLRCALPASLSPAWSAGAEMIRCRQPSPIRAGGPLACSARAPHRTGCFVVAAAQCGTHAVGAHLWSCGDHFAWGKVVAECRQ